MDNDKEIIEKVKILAAEMSKKPTETIVEVNDPLKAGEDLLIYLRPPSIDQRFVLICETLSDYNSAALKTALSAIQQKGYDISTSLLRMCNSLLFFDYLFYDSKFESVYNNYPWETQSNMPLWNIDELLSHWDIGGSTILKLIPTKHDTQESKTTSANNFGSEIQASVMVQFVSGVFEDNIIDKIKKEILPIFPKREKNYLVAENGECVTVDGKTYNFSPTQAEAVKILHEHYNLGTPSVSQAHILNEIDSNADRLRDVFHDRNDGEEFWKKYIIVTRKGSCALK
ncbi:hypothetical protein ACFL2X_05965 [Candidatus Latescibacterota bacterium]